MAQSKARAAKSTSGTKPAKPVAGKFLVDTVGQKGIAASKVRFGSVVVSAIGPKQVEMRRNVSSGQLALARATTNIVKAGVYLRDSNSVPLYHADPKEPGRLIRELNGKLSKGVFIGGKFKVTSKS